MKQATLLISKMEINISPQKMSSDPGLISISRKEIKAEICKLNIYENNNNYINYIIINLFRLYIQVTILW